MFERLVCAVTLVMFGTLVLAQDAELKDPMRPLGSSTSPAAAPPQRFELTATLISDARRLAIINGRTTRVGDAVDGARLLAIERMSVSLRIGSRDFTVPLGRRSAQEEQ